MSEQCVCLKCGGTGQEVFSDTTCGRGGYGGQMITSRPCSNGCRCEHKANEGTVYCVKCGEEADGVLWPEPLSPPPGIPWDPSNPIAVTEFCVMELCRLDFPLFAMTKTNADKVKWAIRKVIDPTIAALRAAQVTTQAPEIRYQLRNWHHVTCAGFGGQACTCLEQREKLIAELAAAE